jgi:hypothetical protein
MKIDQTYAYKKGQTVIMLLLIITVLTLTITHIATLNFSSITLANEYVEGSNLLLVTEGYLENAAIRYLRNPSYIGETIPEVISGDYDCSTAVTSLDANTTDLEATCSKVGRTKTVGMRAVYDNGAFTFSAMSQR